MPPLSLIALTSADAAVVDKWLNKLKQAWNSLEVLEACASTEAQTFCRNLLVPWSNLQSTLERGWAGGWGGEACSRLRLPSFLC